MRIVHAGRGPRARRAGLLDHGTRRAATTTRPRRALPGPASLDLPLAASRGRRNRPRHRRSPPTSRRAGPAPAARASRAPRASGRRPAADNVFRTFRLVYDRALRQPAELPANPSMRRRLVSPRERPRQAIPLDRLEACATRSLPTRTLSGTTSWPAALRRAPLRRRPRRCAEQEHRPGAPR